MTIARLSEVALEYFEHGEGPDVLVFVHGYQASARVWHGVQQALPAQRYRSIAVNNRGAGASQAPPLESDFTVQKFAADLFELVSQLKLDRFTLVGHSMGGATVAQFAVDHPGLVSALVLLDPASPNGAPLDAAQIEVLLDQRMVLRREQHVATAPGRSREAAADAGAACSGRPRRDHPSGEHAGHLGDVPQGHGSACLARRGPLAQPRLPRAGRGAAASIHRNAARSPEQSGPQRFGSIDACAFNER